MVDETSRFPGHQVGQPDLFLSAGQTYRRARIDARPQRAGLGVASQQPKRRLPPVRRQARQPF
uniref:Uncharacterized protein n=1 Tax=Verrucosispora sp. MS100047 TaxID=1410949 RepID=A0A097CRR8_9ACTN|nr:hypothetical protein VASRM7_105 [Verrucosispora sp. MS100047]